MLIIGRFIDQKVFIEVPPSTEPTRIEVIVTEVRGDRVRLGIEAPRSTRILRDDARKTQPATTH